ncbi:bifunctional diaminohydroxyphosphoribosylaminopyrimidine deaminase/5-amino-6-(5-phosphoribosylamino)uracil reductase RibD [Frateuria aurantia]
MSAALFSDDDRAWMVRALALAEQGLYTTAPNPRVGCVIVGADGLAGQGWHQRAGEPHAEVHALREAGDAARGATAYVTLEPCAHHGRTPPCADALIAAGLARVVVACQDPYPAVAGQGIARLRAAGIQVDVGLLQAEARALNIGFFSRIERGRPWLRLKMAMSLDGRTALVNGESQWITGEAARADVHRWRARSSAILGSAATVLADDPQLTVRLEPAADFTAPVRVILDRWLRTPDDARVLDGSAPTWLLHSELAKPSPIQSERARCVAMPERGKHLDLVAVMRWLAAEGINEVHLEAGPTLAGALFTAGLADELLIYMAPILLGDHARPLLQLPNLSSMDERWDLQLLDQLQLGTDLRLRYSCRG